MTEDTTTQAEPADGDAAQADTETAPDQAVAADQAEQASGR